MLASTSIRVTTTAILPVIWLCGGCVENLKFLLAHGAQVDKQNNAGETMLFSGCKKRRNLSKSSSC
jgi:hypothetical protein